MTAVDIYIICKGTPMFHIDAILHSHAWIYSKWTKCLNNWVKAKFDSCSQCCQCYQLHSLLFKLKHNCIFISRACPLWYVSGQMNWKKMSSWVLIKTQKEPLHDAAYGTDCSSIKHHSSDPWAEFLFSFWRQPAIDCTAVHVWPTKARQLLRRQVFKAKNFLPFPHTFFNWVPLCLAHLVPSDQMHPSHRVNLDPLHWASCRAALAASAGDKGNPSWEQPSAGTHPTPHVEPTAQRIILSPRAWTRALESSLLTLRDCRGFFLRVKVSKHFFSSFKSFFAIHYHKAFHIHQKNESSCAWVELSISHSDHQG